jgi:cysteine protease ATG4
MRPTDTFSRRYTRSQSIGIAGGHPSSSYYFAGSQADNLFYLDPHHSRAAVLLQIPPNSTERERGVPIRQITPERGTASPPGHHRSPTSPASGHTGSSTFPHRIPALPSPLSKQLSTSSSSSSGTHARWHSTGANGAGSELSGAASDSGLDLSQLHYVTLAPWLPSLTDCDRGHDHEAMIDLAATFPFSFWLPCHSWFAF